MAYRQPGITIIQNFQAALPALATFQLPSVSVGPAFQVVDQAVAGVYTGEEQEYTYPNQIPGTYVDTRPLDPTDLTSYPVSAYLADTIVQLQTGSSGTVLNTNLNQLVDASSPTIFQNVLPGDVIVVATSGLFPSTTGAIDSTGLVFTDASATFVTDGIAVGQMITVTSPGGAAGTFEVQSITSETQLMLVTGPSGGPYSGVVYSFDSVDNGSYTVRNVVNNTTLQLNETFSAAATALSYSVTRNIGLIAAYAEIQVAPNLITETEVQLPAGLTVNYPPFGTVPILNASVEISYRAQRFDQSGDLQDWNGQTGITDLQNAFGSDQIVPENTLVFAVYVCLLNSPTDTNSLELPETYLNTGDDEGGDELLAYSTALEILSLNDIYAISVLTQNTSVHTALSAHVTTFSAPGENLERVGVINRQLVTTQVVATPSVTGAIDSTGLILTDPNAEFITDGVLPDMWVTVTDPSGAVGTWEVETVVSQTQLTLITGPTGSPYTSVNYYVYENLSTSQQANILAAYAASIGNRRMVMTWPDVVNFPVGNVIRPLPGYYLNSAVIALTTGLPTQQGFTNLSVAGYTGVVHSTKYFSNDQLNVIAGGGVMIFVQEVLNQTALFIRHQLTTDLSSVFFQEFSVTKNVDFVAKFIRNNHKAFIGQYNIVDATFDDLKTAAKGEIDFLVNQTKLPQIGGVLTSGKLTSIEQNPDEIDGILETWTISIPIPLNYLDITLNINGNA